MKTTPIQCPGCGADGAKSLPKRIRLSEDPKLKADILSGAFFEWECPSCGSRYFFEDVFLYNDDIHHFMVYLIAGTKKRLQPVPTVLKTLSGYDIEPCTLRLAAGFADFVEKIRILEAGLDDRVIEAMKTVYAQAHFQTLGENIYNMLFEQKNPDGSLAFAVFLKNEDFAVDIPAAAYQQAESDFEPLLPEPQKDTFVMVDQTWLIQALQNNTGLH